MIQQPESSVRFCGPSRSVCAPGGIRENVVLIDDMRMFGLRGHWGGHASLLELMKKAQAIDDSVMFRLEPVGLQAYDVLVVRREP